MANYATYYVDPSKTPGTGDGLTTSTGFSGIQHALNSTVVNNTTGTKFIYVNDTDDVLTAPLSLVTHGTPTLGNPIVISGSGGMGGISGGGGNFVISDALDYVCFTNLRLHNTGTAYVIKTGTESVILACEIYNSTGGGVNFSGSRCMLSWCNIYDVAGYGIYFLSTGAQCTDNYIKTGAINKLTYGIRGPVTSCYIARNIITVDGASHGIRCELGSSLESLIEYNSILSLSGSGIGISIPNNTDKRGIRVINNVIEGFSGGFGIELIGANNDMHVYGSNSAFNCGTSFSDTACDKVFKLDNEELLSSPFVKTGDNTFANRFTYFAPANTGSVRGGAYVGT